MGNGEICKNDNCKTHGQLLCVRRIFPGLQQVETCSVLCCTEAQEQQRGCRTESATLQLLQIGIAAASEAEPQPINQEINSLKLLTFLNGIKCLN